jgi:hypothetical protein
VCVENGHSKLETSRKINKMLFQVFADFLYLALQCS